MVSVVNSCQAGAKKRLLESIGEDSSASKTDLTSQILSGLASLGYANENGLRAGAARLASL